LSAGRDVCPTTTRQVEIRVFSVRIGCEVSHTSRWLMGDSRGSLLCAVEGTRHLRICCVWGGLTKSGCIHTQRIRRWSWTYPKPGVFAHHPLHRMCQRMTAERTTAAAGRADNGSEDSSSGRTRSGLHLAPSVGVSHHTTSKGHFPNARHTQKHQE
jgi:hypothetical protein